VNWENHQGTVFCSARAGKFWRASFGAKRDLAGFSVNWDNACRHERHLGPAVLKEICPEHKRARGESCSLTWRIPRSRRREDILRRFELITGVLEAL